MTAPLLFLDTETTGLAVDDEIWEVAWILRHPDGQETSYHAFVMHDPDKAAHHLPGCFLDDYRARYDAHAAVDPRRVVDDLGAMIVDSLGPGVSPYLVGIVPSFDIQHLARIHNASRAYAAPAPIPWHYQPIDAEVFAAGLLGVHPPYNSDAISAAVGVNPDDYARHTAMGDARWAQALYDATLRTRPPRRARSAPHEGIQDHDPECPLRWFDHGHLPNKVAMYAAPFRLLALTLAGTLASCPEREVSLRKLLESKDAAVRAAIHTIGQPGQDGIE